METIYIVDKINNVGLEILKKKGFNLYIKPPKMTIFESQAKVDLKKVFAIIIRATSLTREEIGLFPNLKLIVRHGVGVDNLPLATIKKLKIRLTYTPKINSSSVAELTLTFMLMLARNMKYIGEPKIKKDGFLLEGKTIGLIGYGEVAKKVSILLSSFHVNLLVYNHNPKKLIYGNFVSLKKLLRESDIVSLHVPSSKETQNLISVGTISQMKNGACIINTARGSLINTRDLYNALLDKKLFGAAIDVLDEHDIGLREALKKLDNFILTPHIGANTIENLVNSSKRCASEVLRFKNGEEAICSYFGSSVSDG